jgi:hypothetical protein
LNSSRGLHYIAPLAGEVCAASGAFYFQHTPRNR